MTELTWHTGSPSDELNLRVDWFDENNLRQRTDMNLRILSRDKPRTLAIYVKGVKVAEIEATP